MRKLITLPLLTVIGLCLGLLVPPGVFADSLRYLDESGNIHFVDRLSDIPPQYRGQVVTVKPTPVSQEEYRQQLAEWKRQRKAEEREAKRQQREQEKIEKKRQREAERATKKKQQLSKSGKDKQDPASGTATPTPVASPAGRPAVAQGATQ